MGGSTRVEVCSFFIIFGVFYLFLWCFFSNQFNSLKPSPVVAGAWRGCMPARTARDMRGKPNPRLPSLVGLASFFFFKANGRQILRGRPVPRLACRLLDEIMSCSLSAGTRLDEKSALHRSSSWTPTGLQTPSRTKWCRVVRSKRCSERAGSRNMRRVCVPSRSPAVAGDGCNRFRIVGGWGGVRRRVGVLLLAKPPA